MLLITIFLFNLICLISFYSVTADYPLFIHSLLWSAHFQLIVFFSVEFTLLRFFLLDMLPDPASIHPGLLVYSLYLFLYFQLLIFVFLCAQYPFVHSTFSVWLLFFLPSFCTWLASLYLPALTGVLHQFSYYPSLHTSLFIFLSLFQTSSTGSLSFICNLLSKCSLSIFPSIFTSLLTAYFILYPSCTLYLYILTYLLSIQPPRPAYLLIASSSSTGMGIATHLRTPGFCKASLPLNLLFACAIVFLLLLTL